jgi:plastocyanin
MPKHKIHTALLAVVILAACSKPDQNPDTAAAPPTPPAPSVVSFTAADFSYTGPDTIPAGVTTVQLVNNGQQPHHMFMVKLNEGKTGQDLMAAMQAPNATTMPAWAVEVGGPNAAEPGKTIAATMPLDAGSYVIFCVIPGPDGVPHVAKGMMRNLTVVPAATTAAAAPEPTADITMTLMDYGFQLSTPITAGRHTIKFDNTAAQAHEVVLVKLNPGTTIQQWVDAANKMTGPLPGQLMDGIAGMAPGRHGYATVEFTPGEYGLVCFAPDSKDGKPHFLHGMIQQITVN